MVFSGASLISSLRLCDSIPLAKILPESSQTRTISMRLVSSRRLDHRHWMFANCLISFYDVRVGDLRFLAVTLSGFEYDVIHRHNPLQLAFEIEHRKPPNLVLAH